MPLRSLLFFCLLSCDKSDTETHNRRGRSTKTVESLYTVTGLTEPIWRQVAATTRPLARHSARTRGQPQVHGKYGFEHVLPNSRPEGAGVVPS